MIQISRVDTGLINSDTKKILTSTALPLTSGLAILAGVYVSD